MSGVETTPRFEVVATTRRSWSWAQKRSIVAEIAGEATLSQVARRHGIHTSLLFWTSPEKVEGFSDSFDESEEQEWASRRQTRDA